MKRIIVTSLVLCLSRLAAAAGPVPAWCKDATPKEPDLKDLSSKEPREVIVGFVNAMCAPTAEVEDHRADIEKARQAWSKRLGMTEADWADAVAYAKTNDDYSIPVPIVNKTFSAASPLDQYAVIRAAGGGRSDYDTLYATDMFEANLSMVGRYAFLSGTCLDQSKSVTSTGDGMVGSEVTWAICQPDFERVDLAKLLDEVRADTTHDGAAKMKLRIEVYDWPKRVKDHADQVQQMLASDDGKKKLFEAAAGARAAWATSVGKHTRLLELVSTMESAARTKSRKQFDGCAETTATALADAASTLPAKLFAGMHDNPSNHDNPFDVFATKAAPVLGQSAPVNLAAIAYVLCTPSSPTSFYLRQVLYYGPPMRGPRSAALGRLRDEKIELDNVKAVLDFPKPQPYGDGYPKPVTQLASHGGVVRSVKRAGKLLTVEREKEMVEQEECLKSHYTGRVSRVRDNGSVEYERVCDKSGKVSYNQASTPLTVYPQFEALLKPGVLISITVPSGIEGDVIAVWPNKKAKLPSIVLGGSVK